MKAYQKVCEVYEQGLLKGIKAPGMSYNATQNSCSKHCSDAPNISDWINHYILCIKSDDNIYTRISFKIYVHI